MGTIKKRVQVTEVLYGYGQSIIEIVKQMPTKSILMISALMLLVLGCSTSSPNAKKDINVRIGFDGLAMEFMRNTPPIKVFEGETFPVIIKVRNNGAYSISNINNEKAISSLGVEKDYTKGTKLLESGKIKKAAENGNQIENAASFSLEGKSPINLKGEEEVVSYNVIAGKVDPQSEAHPSTVTAALCYPYKTELDTAVCIEPDISNLRTGKKVCQPQDLVFNQGQGAPVAVTKIEVSMLPAQTEGNPPDKIVPQFLMLIENRGKGTVIKKEAVGNFCIQSDTSHENINIVNVEAFLGSEKLNCENAKGESFVKLKDKKEIIRCTLKKGISASNDAYLSPLKVILDYGYTTSISASYFIQKVAG